MKARAAIPCQPDRSPEIEKVDPPGPRGGGRPIGAGAGHVLQSFRFMAVMFCSEISSCMKYRIVDAPLREPVP